jgi:hypothetical protein
VVSDELAVSTGLPDQDSISLGAEVLNPEAWHHNNVPDPIIFQAADLFNNFVPDGTVVYFTTEGGSIIASSVIKDGVCEVLWRSGNPRPDNAIFTILAFCIGEESFNDRNGNGIFDEDDLFNENTDLAEPFLDANENRDYDYGEWFWDYNANGEFDGEPNGKYNGSLCSDDEQLCTKELVYVQASISLIMSGSYAEYITITPDPIVSDRIIISVSDLHGHPMPYDTSIEVKIYEGKFKGNLESVQFTVPNTNSPGLGFGTTDFTARLNEGSSRSPFNFQVTVTTPLGHVTTWN